MKYLQVRYIHVCPYCGYTYEEIFSRLGDVKSIPGASCEIICKNCNNYYDSAPEPIIKEIDIK